MTGEPVEDQLLTNLLNIAVPRMPQDQSIKDQPAPIYTVICTWDHHTSNYKPGHMKLMVDR